MEQRVDIKIDGNAVTLQGFGSALTKTDEVFIHPYHNTYRGRALAVFRSGKADGKSTVTVSSENTEPVSFSIEVTGGKRNNNMAQLYCNPLEIAYKYQHPLFGKYAYKEAADPTVILFNNKYFLFTSKCGGFYYSDDLFHWDFHEDRKLEIHGYAPDVSEHDGWLYFCASSYSKKSRILRTRDPFKGFELVSAPFAFCIRTFILKTTKRISIGAVLQKSLSTRLRWI